MNSLLKIVGVAVGIAALVGVGFYSTRPVEQVQTQTFGAFTPVGGQTYSLAGAGVNSSVTSITLNSFKTPDGRIITMSMFGAIGYAVIDPNSPTKIENITFTGVQQNANGTAVLTGVSRGIDFVSPYAASTSLAQAHAGGSYLALSNTASFYGQQFLFANNVSTSSAYLVFSSTSQPYYDGDPTFTNPRALIDKFYADSLTINGAPTSTYSGMGVVQLGTPVQLASSTASSTPGAPFVVLTKYGTTTPGRLCNTGIWNCFPVAQVSGKIAQTWLDLTEGWTFTNATTTSLGLTGSLYWNNFLFSLNYSQPAGTTTLQVSSTGRVSLVPATVRSIAVNSTFPSTTSSATTTLLTVVVAANTLTTGNSMRVQAQWDQKDANDCAVEITFGTGSASTTVMSSAGNGAGAGSSYSTSGTIFATSTTAQSSAFISQQIPAAPNTSAILTVFGSKRWTNFSNSAQLYLGFNARNMSSATCYLTGATVEALSN